MPEAQSIVALAQRARASGEQLCLVTVVHVEGSAYRKPGARMLLTSGGERAGTISGGCLESEISRKAWWLAAGGPRVERYSSFADEDGGMPYGLGCGGTISLLLEQGEAAEAVLTAMERVLTSRQPAVVITALGIGPAAPTHQAAGTVAVLLLTQPSVHLPYPPLHVPAIHPFDIVYLHPAPSTSATALDDNLAHAARSAFEQQQSFYLGPSSQPALPEYFVEYLAPPPALTIFGAGDDAQPLAALAHALGWRVAVVDGRAHLARRERFPQAAEVRVLDYADPSLRAACGQPLQVNGLAYRPGLTSAPTPAGNLLLCDPLAVILTHSYEQDRALLGALLPRELHYLGILGPRHRTHQLLLDLCPTLGLSLEQTLARLHSPIGLDLGTGDPSAIALSIVAEIQAVLHNRKVVITQTAPPERNTVSLLPATARHLA